MKIIYAGSPSIAVPSLERLINIDGVELVGVLTNPDTPKGRSGTLTPTEVGVAAEKFDVSILKPYKLDAAAREEISALKPDLLVSFAYGHIFGPKFLSIFPLGGINIHPSLLPKYRGPTPIQAAILNRDTETGISIQKLALEVDSGDILCTEKLLLNGTETTVSLSELVAAKSAELLSVTLNKIAAVDLSGIPQDHSKASFCHLICKDDGIIDWNLSAEVIDAKIRAYTPWPLCRTIHNGHPLFILKAGIYEKIGSQQKCGYIPGIDKERGILIQTGCGVLAATELQYQGKKALFWKDFLNGAHDFINSILG